MNFKVNKTVLENGLKVLTLPMQSIPSITSLVMVKAGSRWEAEKRAGISHFLEHMVFKGTEKYPSHIALASAVDSIGAEFNAFTSKEYTGFYVRGASDHLDLSLDVLSEMIWRPLIPSKDIKKEKPVIFEEINMRNDHPMLKAEEEFECLMYGEKSLGRPIIGTKDTVAAISRDDFEKYRNNWYYPENIVLGLVGDERIIDREDTLELVKKYFAIKKEKGLEQKNTFTIKKDKKRLLNKKTQQAHFCLGVPALERGHKDRYILSLLTVILGSTFSSRLFLEVREKRGLAYYVKTSPETYLKTGYIMTQAGTEPKNLKEAVKVIKNEYEKIKKADASLKKDLKWAKEYLKGKLALKLEEPKSVASFYIEDLLLEKRLRDVDEIISKIEAVEAEDIAALAEKIFKKDQLRLSVIGPYKNLDNIKI